MLHRAFTEVPDYAIASKGFIGGVPPLSSLQGLPSYEESARLGDRYRHLAPPVRTATPDPISASRTGGIGGVQAGVSQVPVASLSALSDDRRVMSDSDLARRFQGLGTTSDMLYGRDADGEIGAAEDTVEDDGIRMRGRGGTMMARREDSAEDDGIRMRGGGATVITTGSREDPSEDDGILMGRRRTVTGRKGDAT